MSGADRALVASDQARSGLGPSGFDHGYKFHRVPCAHGEHGPCLKCQLIEERLASCADERRCGGYQSTGDTQ
jgi:hypothetical protein